MVSCKTEGTSFLRSFILNVSVCRMAYFNGSEAASLFRSLHLEESSDLVHAKIIFCFHALVSITNSYITQFRSFLVELISLAMYIAIWYLTQPHSFFLLNNLCWSFYYLYNLLPVFSNVKAICHRLFLSF